MGKGDSNIPVWGIRANQSDEHGDNLEELLFPLRGDRFFDDCFGDKYVEAGRTLEGRPTSCIEEAATVCGGVLAVAFRDV